MKLPTLNNISLEQLKGITDWGRLLVSQINLYLQAVYNGLDKNITLSENIRCQERLNVAYRTASDYETNDTFAPITFPNTLKGGVIPQHLQLTKFVKVDAPYAAYTKPVVLGNWQCVNGVITVYFIAGLEDSTRYTFNFLAY